jgi:hypothetical protein
MNLYFDCMHHKNAHLLSTSLSSVNPYNQMCRTMNTKNPNIYRISKGISWILDLEPKLNQKSSYCKKISTKERKKKEGFLPSLERMNRPGWSPWSAGWRGFGEQEFRPEVVVNGHTGGRDGGEHSRASQGGGTWWGCSHGVVLRSPAVGRTQVWEWPREEFLPMRAMWVFFEKLCAMSDWGCRCGRRRRRRRGPSTVAGCGAWAAFGCDRLRDGFRTNISALGFSFFMILKIYFGE